MQSSKANKYAHSNLVGRPPHFETPEDLHKKAMEYFEDCVQEKQKVTITGLCLHLGFSSRSSLDDYEKRSDEFSYIIKRCRLAVENSYETNGQTIDIFALKNMGWKDKSEMGFTDNEGNDVTPVQIFQLPDNNRQADNVDKNA